MDPMLFTITYFLFFSIAFYSFTIFLEIQGISSTNNWYIIEFCMDSYLGLLNIKKNLEIVSNKDIQGFELID
ncbi:hypothetical protein PNEG_04306 [Pneumocystis murina B123]|uniref:Uncharacterized protein n=1 Tax=Pneumocystis murina (strain B123) TaxID=1069680 RepID=A0A0W4ZWZ2_PNEMU|nr:hypothetical protein PNEG_04306 [Pneumocystis murina B123]KTW32887.1 hypothetical protein PNEG_04306 [Pneumocystis murina B123]